MSDRREERLTLLREALVNEGTLHLRDAATLCGVSEMTIRRDLHTCSQSISLIGGRLIKVSPQASAYDLIEQQALGYPAKYRLCQRALSFIDEGDTLFIDCGSTLLPLLGFLARFKALTVVTYALNVATSVAKLPSVRLIVLGGLYYPASQSFGGERLAEQIRGLGINKALITAAGIDDDQGVSCFHFHEVAPKKAAIATAEKRILLADTRKMGVVRPAYFATLGDFDVLVTDDEQVSKRFEAGLASMPDIAITWP
ncbi:DeoR/GlpR family DNA-binding transcription regulator [Halomonas sp. PAMB 3264]|uniref:DeoR/GlpR family DNA-binding transcription regulator n=1 Tax=Halomonas sp. PAMB 3264 TaxID=3075222 RepID=UPI0028994EF7|nr:DeoR/GlpR family DNA-binding transcription regulator [Halomonas sp. PAMB 3264]WNL41438.1 DeoR/GlpR family DNA-binding transcription regulator [Halomonas sp. PAMB 3264]